MGEAEARVEEKRLIVTSLASVVTSIDSAPSTETSLPDTQISSDTVGSFARRVGPRLARRRHAGTFRAGRRAKEMEPAGCG